MQLNYFCTSIPILPDTGVECLSPVFFFIIVIGFVFIVLLNEKYRYMAEWLLKKLNKWF